MPESASPTLIRLLRILSLACVMVLGLATFDASSRLGKPFAGFLYEYNLNLATVGPADWNGIRQGLRSMDLLVVANGRALATAHDLDALVASVPLGTPITYVYLRQDKAATVTVATQRFGWPQFASSALIYLLPAFLFSAIGLAVFWLRPHSPAAHAHLLMTLACAMTQASMMFLYFSHRWPHYFMIVVYGVGAGFMHLGLVFPTNLLGKRLRGAWLAYLPLLLAAIPFLAYYRPVGYGSSPAMLQFYLAHLQIYGAWTALGPLVFVGNVVVSGFKSPTARARNQAWVVLLGMLAGFFPFFFSYLIPTLLGHISQVNNLQILVEIAGFHLFPLSIAYAIVRHQLFDIQLVVRRATLYLALTSTLAGLYVVVALASFAALDHLSPHQPGPSLSGFLAALSVAVVFGPAHRWLKKQIDRLFLGKRADALALLANFQPRSGVGREAVGYELCDRVMQALAASWVEIRVGESFAVHRGEPQEASPELVLRFALSAPRIGQELIVGPKLNGLPYNAEEKALLSVVAAQARLALDNVQLVEARVALEVREGVARELAEERQRVLMQVVHDLRTDLFNIVVAAQLAEIRSTEPEPLRVINQSVERIEAFLAEKTRWVKEERREGFTEVGPAIERASQVMVPQLRQKRQRLDYQVGVGEQTCSVSLSTLELEQVLVNLLSNASKFAPEDSEIRLETVIDDHQLVLRVVDQGPGFDPDRPAMPGSGSGLGLKNVRALLEGAGGRLAWHNADPGAAFEVILPLRDPAAAVDPRGARPW